MRFAPRLSVGARLTLTMVLVVVLSWLLGGTLVFYLLQWGVLRGGPQHRKPAAISESAEAARRLPLAAAQSRAAQPEAREPRSEPERGEWAPPPPPDARHAERRLRPWWRNKILLIHLGVGLVVAVVAGLWLSRRFTRPLAMLAEGAQALEGGRLDHRVALAGHDEFARVATSMDQMAERIAAQIGELEEDSRRRQHLLADVAHELRSPVARIKTMAEAFRDGLATQPERSQRASRSMVDSADQMERLVNDLLELAQLDLHALPLNREPVDLRALAAECLMAQGEAAQRAGITVRPVEPGDPVVVEGDRHRLAQVLDNLIDNAVSHAGAGAEVQVMVAPGQQATVTVADTGSGIGAEHLPYVFDAFYRADTARTPSDRHSGLGLRIARSLAEAHGGTLEVSSTVGEGTRAVLTLPAEATHAFRA